MLRDTPFSRVLVAELWDNLSSLERIDILTQLGSIPTGLFKKAFNDTSPVVRMLAVKSFYLDQGEEPELYEKIRSDRSPLVQAAIQETEVGLDLEEMGSLSQIEKLGVVALSGSILDESFADFIIKGISNQIISEQEASALVFEFVRNPHCKFAIERESLDGLDNYSLNKGFNDIWNLTTCTSRKVHHAIVWEYSLTTGDGDTIPEEMLNRMSNETLEALVWRNHKPLLDLVKKNPKKFDNKIVGAVETNSDYPTSTAIIDPIKGNDIDLLRVELLRVKEEINERFDLLTQQLRDVSS